MKFERMFSLEESWNELTLNGDYVKTFEQNE